MIFHFKYENFFERDEYLKVRFISFEFHEF